MNTATIMGVRFSAVTLQQAVVYAMERIEKKEKGYVATPNAEIVYMCRTEAGLADLLNQAFLTLPDGIGVIYAAKLLHEKLYGKVAGIDFAELLLARLGQAGGSVFFLGGKPGVAQIAAEKMQQKHPGLVVKGYCDGYFENSQQAIDAINAVGGVDVAFICLGAPKQEQFMAQHMPQIDATLLCGLGGTLDVFAGTVQRAPKIFIQLGLEWFYRLCKEPQRIGRMMRLPKFMLWVLQTKWSKQKGAS